MFPAALFPRALFSYLARAGVTASVVVPSGDDVIKSILQRLDRLELALKLR